MRAKRSASYLLGRRHTDFGVPDVKTVLAVAAGSDGVTALRTDSFARATAFSLHGGRPAVGTSLAGVGKATTVFRALANGNGTVFVELGDSDDNGSTVVRYHGDLTIDPAFGTRGVSALGLYTDHAADDDGGLIASDAASLVRLV